MRRITQLKRYLERRRNAPAVAVGIHATNAYNGSRTCELILKRGLASWKAGDLKQLTSIQSKFWTIPSFNCWLIRASIPKLGRAWQTHHFILLMYSFGALSAPSAPAAQCNANVSACLCKIICHWIPLVTLSKSLVKPNSWDSGIWSVWFAPFLENARTKILKSKVAETARKVRKKRRKEKKGSKHKWMPKNACEG